MYKGILYSNEYEQARTWITWMNITNITLNYNDDKPDTKEYIGRTPFIPSLKTNKMNLWSWNPGE